MANGRGAPSPECAVAIHTERATRYRRPATRGSKTRQQKKTEHLGGTLEGGERTPSRMARSKPRTVQPARGTERQFLTTADATTKMLYFPIEYTILSIPPSIIETNNTLTVSVFSSMVALASIWQVPCIDPVRRVRRRIARDGGGVRVSHRAFAEVGTGAEKEGRVKHEQVI